VYWASPFFSKFQYVLDYANTKMDLKGEDIIKFTKEYKKWAVNDRRKISN